MLGIFLRYSVVINGKGHPLTSNLPKGQIRKIERFFQFNMRAYNMDAVNTHVNSGFLDLASTCEDADVRAVVAKSDSMPGSITALPSTKIAT